MRIRIDHSRCEANGLCENAAPSVFRLTDDDSLTLVGTGQVDSLDEETRSAVDMALASCPRNALSLEEE